MTMSGDRFNELISKAWDVSIATGNKSRSKFKLVFSRCFISSSHYAGRRKQFDTGSAGSDRLAVLVSLVQKVSHLRFAFERRHTGVSLRNTQPTKTTSGASKKAKICLDHRTLCSCQNPKARCNSHDHGTCGHQCV